MDGEDLDVNLFWDKFYVCQKKRKLYYIMHVLKKLLIKSYLDHFLNHLSEDTVEM